MGILPLFNLHVKRKTFLVWSVLQAPSVALMHIHMPEHEAFWQAFPKKGIEEEQQRT